MDKLKSKRYALVTLFLSNYIITTNFLIKKVESQPILLPKFA